MIVTMTGRQRSQLLFHGRDDLAEAVERGSTQRTEGGKWWQIEMPAIAWKLLITQLRPRLEGPRGGFPAAVQSMRVALMRAQKELNRLEHHPALSRGSLMGWHTEAIPAWNVTGGRRYTGEQHYSLYPADGEFTILVDHHQLIRGHEVTTWAPGLAVSGRLTHQESEHLVFGVDKG